MFNKILKFSSIKTFFKKIACLRSRPNLHLFTSSNLQPSQTYKHVLNNLLRLWKKMLCFLGFDVLWIIFAVFVPVKFPHGITIGSLKVLKLRQSQSQPYTFAV